MTAPYLKHKSTSIKNIMLDVIVALVPIAMVAYWAFGNFSLIVMGSCVSACIISDLIFGFVFLKHRKVTLDGAGIITGLLLSFTLSPLTPWYIAAFGGVMSILFGKILWGGLGKNKFNPALVGREFMAVFFPAVMSSGDLWNISSYVENSKMDFSAFFYSKTLASQISGWIYQPSGALGEYALGFIILGGIYLIFRKRISWHIPITFLLTFFILRAMLDLNSSDFSVGGVLIGSIYMATDMPSSPSHNNGKIYYGIMLGVAVSLLLYSGVKFAYMSYGILILNGFSTKISEKLKPAAWGHQSKIDWQTMFYLTLSILSVTLAVVSLEYAGLTAIPVYLYIIYMLLKYHYHTEYKIFQPF